MRTYDRLRCLSFEWQRNRIDIRDSDRCGGGMHVHAFTAIPKRKTRFYKKGAESRCLISYICVWCSYHMPHEHLNFFSISIIHTQKALARATFHAQVRTKNGVQHSLVYEYLLYLCFIFSFLSRAVEIVQGEGKENTINKRFIVCSTNFLFWPWFIEGKTKTRSVSNGEHKMPTARHCFRSLDKANGRERSVSDEHLDSAGHDWADQLEPLELTDSQKIREIQMQDQLIFLR